MARIQLIIDAEDMSDLADTLSALRYPSAYTSEYADEPVNEVAQAEEVQIAEAGEPAATTRRRRRTSAEIAADAQSAAQGNATSASATSASAASPAPSASSQTQPGPQSSAGKAPDPFGDQIKQVAAETKAEEAAAAAGPTSDDIQAAALAFSMAKSMVEAQKVLMSFTAENGDPVKTIKQVQPKDYAAVLAALQV